MTIASQTNKHLYSGDGAQTVFPYAFKIFAASDLVVIRRAADGTETTLTLTTHYTVSGVGSDAGGNVTLVGTQAASPPAVGEKLLVKRVIPLTQPNDLVQDGPLPEPVIEGALDRLVCMVQQQQEQIDRSLKVGATSTLGTVIDPTSIATDAAKAASNAAAAATSAAQAAASAASVNPGQPGGTGTLDGAGQAPVSQLGNAKKLAIIFG
jgi:hypothetical protein